MSAARLMVRVCQLALVALAASRSLHAAAAPNFDALDPLGTTPRSQAAAKKQAISIEIAPGNWGKVAVRDIKLVLDSAAGELLSHVGASSGEIRILVIPRSGSPKALYERGADGQYVIHLTARNDQWFQYVFQFAHELCHVLSNFDRKDVIDGEVHESNQWFEESLCETASLFTLRRLAAVWETNPPTRNWAGYANTFSAYAIHLMKEPHRHLPAGQSFREWFAENKESLRYNPYQREKNELVAANLLPLFEARPELWQAIAYLNPNKTSAGKPFGQYLADWQAAIPDKNLPVQILDLFGFPYGRSLPGQDAGEPSG